MGFFTRVFRLHFSLWLGLAVLAGVALAMPASAVRVLSMAMLASVEALSTTISS